MCLKTSLSPVCSDLSRAHAPSFFTASLGCVIWKPSEEKKKSHLIFESSFLQIQEYLWISEESFILKLCEIMKYNLDKQPPFNIFKPGALKTFSLQENTMPRVKVVILCLVTILLYFAHYKFSLNTIEVLVEKRKKKIYYMTFWKRQIYDYHKNGNHISNYQDL